MCLKIKENKKKIKINNNLAILPSYDMLNNMPIIKFTHKYNIEVHCLLAAKGLASRLHYSSIDNCKSRCLA